MEEYSCKLNIGGLLIRFVGIPLKAEKYTLPFLVKEGFDTPEADHTVYVTASDDMALPEGKLVYEDFEQCCFVNGDDSYTARIRIRGNIPYVVSHDRRGEHCNRVVIEKCTLFSDDWLRRVLLYSNMPHIMLDYGRLMLHSSYISTEHGGIVFCGRSGAGKSTQAELWREHRGAEIINGDRSLVNLERDENGLPFARVHSMPFAGTSGICYNKSTRLLAAVAVKQGPYSRAQRLKGAAAVRAILENSVVESWRRDENARAAFLAADIAGALPVIELTCLPDETAVNALERLLIY